MGTSSKRKRDPKLPTIADLLRRSDKELPPPVKKYRRYVKSPVRK